MRLDLSRAGLGDGARPSARPRCRPRSPRWRRSRAGPSPTPTSSAWSATTGCARRSWRPRRRSRARSARHARAGPGIRRRVHGGRVAPQGGERFTRRPARSASAARRSGRSSWPTRSAAPRDRLRPHFLDNTDPDGFDRVLGRPRRAASPRRWSSSSPSPAARPRRATACSRRRRPTARAGSTSPRHAVAVTGAGSALDRQARDRGLARALPDVGLGRRAHLGDCRRWGSCRRRSRGSTSTRCSRARPRWTRPRAVARPADNPAALLALMWHSRGEGRGEKDMVVLPYKDRLAPLQPLPAAARDGVARQGAGPRGPRRPPGPRRLRQQGLDRPARLRAAAARRRRRTSSRPSSGAAGPRGRRALEVEPGVDAAATTSTASCSARARALYENGRASMTITIPEVDARTPRRADRALRAGGRLLRRAWSTSTPTTSRASRPARRPRPRCSTCRGRSSPCWGRGAAGGTCEDLAAAAGAPDEAETVFHLLERLAANPDRGVARRAGPTPWEAAYRAR